MSEPESARIHAGTVHRVERADDSLGGRQRDELNRYLEEEAVARAESSTRLSDLTRRSLAPLHRLVEADPAARDAIAELRDQRILEFERHSELERSATIGFFGGPDLIPRLHRGINVFGPPYDFDVSGPRKGPVDATPNRLDGTFTVNLHWGFGGARFATAGVGLALRAGATGVAHVRPSWAYDYQGIAYGSNLSSHTEGAAKVIVQDAVTGAVLKEVTRPLWHFDNDRWEDGDGFIDSWALGVDVFLKAGQRFTATFLATAMVDDSGTDFLFGWSLAKAHLQMRAPFVVVELGP